MKKSRVFFWIDIQQKERLEDLSRKTRVLLSEYVKEAIEDLLEKHEEQSVGPVQERTEEGAGHLSTRET